MQMKLFYPLALILAAFVFNGCSKENRPDDLPKLYPVTLTFTLDGRPLDNALVNLVTEDKTISKWTVGSVTDAEGKAIIVTHGQFRGAPAGKFKVCVKKTELSGGQAPQKSQTEFVVDLSPSSLPKGMPKMINHVDPVFGDVKTTLLEIEVPASRKMTNLTLDVNKPR